MTGRAFRPQRSPIRLSEVAGTVLLGAVGWLAAGSVGLSFGIIAGFCALLLHRLVLAATVMSPWLLAGFTLLDGEFGETAIPLFTSTRLPTHLLGQLTAITWLAASWVIWQRADRTHRWERPSVRPKSSYIGRNWRTLGVLPVAIVAALTMFLLID